MKKIAVMIAVCALLLAGCAMTFADGLEGLEVTRVESDNGFAFTIPADWTAKTADADFQKYSYQSADGAIELSVFMELGGMEYYSLEEIGDILCGDLAEGMYATSKNNKSGVTESRYHCLISGTEESGAELASLVDIFRPYTGIRCYMVFTATAAAYRDNNQVISGIADSFTVTMSEDELYALMAAERDQESAATETEQDDSSDELSTPESGSEIL